LGTTPGSHTPPSCSAAARLTAEGYAVITWSTACWSGWPIRAIIRVWA